MFRALIVISVVLYPTAAFAYIDIGTGSLILQAILAGIGAAAIFFSRLRYAVIGYFRRLFGREQSDRDASGEK